MTAPEPEERLLRAAEAMDDALDAVYNIDPAWHATKSRDYGRGFAEALRVVRERIDSRMGAWAQRDKQAPGLTTEVTVACSYCGEPVTVPFKVGAVMPLRNVDRGVAAYVPRLDGGDHVCQSQRHQDEREHHLRREKT